MSRETGSTVECPICGSANTKVMRTGIIKCPHCGEIWQCVGCGIWLSEHSDHRDCDDLAFLLNMSR